MTNLIDSHIKSQVLAKICTHSQEGIFILDADWCFVWVNESLSMILGYTEDELLRSPLAMVTHDPNSHQPYSLIHRLQNNLQIEDYFFSEFSCHTRYDVYIDANITVWRVDVEGEFYYAGAIRDVRGSMATKRTLEKVLNFDQTTGLPNRTFFMSQLADHLLETYQELVIVRFNIDRFRAYLNALDETVIDDLLNQLANRIRRLALGNLKIFSHYGVDDFAMLFECKHADMARDALEQIMQQFEMAFGAGEEQVYLHISMGVSVYPKDGEQMDVLVRNAEKAMNFAKHSEGQDVVWYDTSLGMETLPSLKLEAQIRRALENGEFVAYYQPKYELQTGQLAGFETLVRWHHPTRGLLTPFQFIHTIIESRLSFELFEQMLNQATTQILAWLYMDHSVNVCINTDASEFRHPSFLSSLQSALDKAHTHPNFDASKMIIEMTESSLMIKDDTSVDAVNALKNMGLSVALDDFGTGYASLSYLHYYPFDYVKIDKSFIDDIVHDQKHCDIVEAIVTMTHRLGMKVIAEGIETEAQANLVRKLGCEYAQGYYYGKPMSAREATDLLKMNSLK